MACLMIVGSACTSEVVPLKIQAEDFELEALYTGRSIGRPVIMSRDFDPRPEVLFVVFDSDGEHEPAALAELVGLESPDLEPDPFWWTATGSVGNEWVAVGLLSEYLTSRSAREDGPGARELEEWADSENRDDLIVIVAYANLE